MGAHFSWKLRCSRPGLLPATCSAADYVVGRYAPVVRVTRPGPGVFPLLCTREEPLPVASATGSSERDSMRGDAKLARREMQRKHSSLHLQCRCLSVHQASRRGLVCGSFGAETWAKAKSRQALSSRNKAEATRSFSHVRGASASAPPVGGGGSGRCWCLCLCNTSASPAFSTYLARLSA